MAREKVIVEQEKVFCDHCGKELTEEDVDSFTLVARGIGSWDMKEHIVFEGGLHGDYCNSCLLELQSKVLENLAKVLWERYSKPTDKSPDERLWKLVDGGGN